MKNQALKKVGLAVGSLAFAGSAMAQESGGMDVSAVVTVIVGVGVAAGLLGAAVLIVKVGIKAWKMVAGAI